jgi:D-glycero-D-manno-heptose 1,7-bisphosphate phosphatase
MHQRSAIFLDKDGTVLVDVPYNVDPDKMYPAPGALAALRQLGRHDWPLIVVSNQSGVALGRFAQSELTNVQARLAQMFDESGARLHDFYCCPHHPQGSVSAYARACSCRKPEPGMLLRAAVDHGIDLPTSWMVGDILNDVEAGRRAGCRTILIDNGNETEWQMLPQRTPDFVVTDLEEAARIIIACASASAVDTSATAVEGPP